MAAPLEQIKQGILEQSWQLVCDGYAAMTGESLNVVDKPNFSLKVQNNSKKPKKTKATIRKPKSKEAISSEKEEPALFNDDGTLCTRVGGLDLIADSKNAKPGEKFPRRPPKYVDVICRICKKSEQVHEALAPKKIGEEFSSHVCNACAARGK